MTDIKSLTENVIKHIKECVNKDGCYYEGTDTELCDLADELAQEAIKDYLSIQLISVEERLPEVGQAVICAMKTEDGEWWHGCCIYREFGFPWVQLDNPNPVQYWMPLPIPPENK